MLCVNSADIVFRFQFSNKISINIEVFDYKYMENTRRGEFRTNIAYHNILCIYINRHQSRSVTPRGRTTLVKILTILMTSLQLPP